MGKWDSTAWRPQEESVEQPQSGTPPRGKKCGRWLGGGLEGKLHLKLFLVPEERKPCRDSSCFYPGNLRTPCPFFLFLKA